MARSRRGSFPVRTSNRRRTAWTDGPGGTVVTQLAAAIPVFLGSAVTPTVEGITIARIRGRLRMMLSTGTSALDGLVGAFGLGIASLAAVTAGTGSVPTPISEQGAESWLFWTPFQLLVPEAFSNETTALSAFFDIEVDTKAMRRFPTEDALYAMCEAGTETGTAVAQIFFDSRVLSFLP